jgi:hypothetical protein
VRNHLLSFTLLMGCGSEQPHPLESLDLTADGVRVEVEAIRFFSPTFRPRGE